MNCRDLPRRVRCHYSVWLRARIDTINENVCDVSPRHRRRRNYGALAAVMGLAAMAPMPMRRGR